MFLYDWLDFVFGLGLNKETLTIWHLVARALFVYLFGIILVRTQRQFMNINTPFNFILNFILGSVLANAIIGTVPFFPVIGMALVIALINLLIAKLSYHFPSIELLIKGKPEILIQDGKIQWDVMRKNLITQDELMDSVHRITQSEDISTIKTAYFENSGRITIVRK